MCVSCLFLIAFQAEISWRRPVQPIDLLRLARVCSIDVLQEPKLLWVLRHVSVSRIPFLLSCSLIAGRGNGRHWRCQLPRGGAITRRRMKRTLYLSCPQSDPGGSSPHLPPPTCTVWHRFPVKKAFTARAFTIKACAAWLAIQAWPMEASMQCPVFIVWRACLHSIHSGTKSLRATIIPSLKLFRKSIQLCHISGSG